MQHNMQALQRENALLQAQAQELRQNTALLGGNLQVRAARVRVRAGRAEGQSCYINTMQHHSTVHLHANVANSMAGWKQRHGLMPPRRVDVGTSRYKPRCGDTA